MQKLFYFSFFLLPLLYFNIFQNQNITFADIVYLVLFVFVLFKLKLHLTLTTRVYLFFIFVYLISGFLSIYKASSIYNATFGILQHAFIFIGVFLVLMHFIQDRNQIEKIMKILIFMGVASVIYTLLFDTYTSHGRHFSFFGSLSVYGLFLTSIIPFVWYFFSKSKNVFYKIFLIVSFFMLVYGLVLSGSRSGIIVLVINIFIILYFSVVNNIKRRNARILIYFLYFTCLFIFVINIETFIKQVIQLVLHIQPNLAIKLETLLISDLREIDASRFDNIISFFSNIKNYIFLGVGFNNFYIVTNSMSLHSFLFAIWAELGFLSFISMLFLIIYLLFKLYTLYKKYKDNLLATLLTCNVSCFIFMSLNPLYTHRVTWIFFIIAYTTIILYERERCILYENSIYFK